MKKGVSYILVLVVGLCLMSGVVFGDTIYVATDGNDVTGDGSSGSPYKTIQRGIDEAPGGGAEDPCVVSVGSGIYESGPITVDSYQSIVFDEGVEVIAKSTVDGYFLGARDCLFKADSKNNITIDGNDTILRMQNEEYPTAQEFDAYSDVNLTNDTITVIGHGFTTGYEVIYSCDSAQTCIGGLYKNVWYKIIKCDNDTVQLSADGVNVIDLTSKPGSSETQELYPDAYRHVINIFSSSKIEIKDVTLKDSGGDGIYIGSDTEVNACADITIKNVICDGNRRNGISVTNVAGIAIEDSVIRNTQGAHPQAGIDFEPNRAYQNLSDIVVKNVRFVDNYRDGVLIDIHNLTDESNDISFDFDNIYVEGGTDSEGGGVYIRSPSDEAPDGFIDFNDVTIKGSVYGAKIWKSAGALDEVFSLVFKHCVWYDTEETPIVIRSYSSDAIDYPGGVHFNGCQVYDSVDRAAIRTQGEICAGGKDLFEVTGSMNVENDQLTGAMYDWNGADTNNVTLCLSSGIAAFCKVYNVTEQAWYSTVQAAIDNAAGYDDLAVYPGTFVENLDFKGKSITLRSIDPDDWGVVEDTVIDGNSVNKTVLFIRGEDSGAVLTGLTVTNAGYEGIRCQASSPVISNCLIAGNNNGYGVLVSHSGANPTLSRNMIMDNSSGVRVATAAAVTITNSAICDNNTYGVIFYDTTSGDKVIINSTIANNSYGVFCADIDWAPTITNCVIWNNCSDDLRNCGATYSCMKDLDTGTGNIVGDANDPNFVDAVNDDYSIASGSACVDAGDPNTDSGDVGDYDLPGNDRFIDGDGQNGDEVDMGSYEYQGS